jgi:hypothetical protein
MNNTILASVMIFNAVILGGYYGPRRDCGMVACFSEMLRNSISYHQGEGCSLGGPHRRWRCSSFSSVLHRLANLQRLATCVVICDRQCQMRGNMEVKSVVYVIYVLRFPVLCE